METDISHLELSKAYTFKVHTGAFLSTHICSEKRREGERERERERERESVGECEGERERKRGRERERQKDEETETEREGGVSRKFYRLCYEDT